MTPARIQLSRAKGWRMPPNTVKVDRTTSYGNPFRVGFPVDMRLARKWGWKIKHPEHACNDVAEAVFMFTRAIAFDGASAALLQRELRGKNLACWCPPGAPCHAEVILKIANG